MSRSLLFLVPLLVSCSFGGGVTKSNWGDQYAQKSCAFSKRCAPILFYYAYDDMDECKDEYLDAWEDSEDYYDDCDFDKDKAQDCLNKMSSTTCKEAGEDYEDVFEDCAEVWDCGDATDTTTTTDSDSD
jgi:hypothetical protein